MDELRELLEAAVCASTPILVAATTAPTAEPHPVHDTKIPMTGLLSDGDPNYPIIQRKLGKTATRMVSLVLELMRVRRPSAPNHAPRSITIPAWQTHPSPQSET